ncbi:MAG: hypothetical protein VB106_18345 [Clostridiaceae bacterium]|nr:hypothetical protein [Clostridiaceae bacterium]
MNEDEYKVCLRKKLEIIKRMDKNSLSQCQALKSNDVDLFGKLLKRQQGNIDRLKRIKKPDLSVCSFEKDEETDKLERDIAALSDIVIQRSTLNMLNAERLKNEMGISLYNLKVNRNAIKNGYFKNGCQQKGYFIDKKVGK